MNKAKNADSLVGIIIGVFILSFTLLGIINILNFNKATSSKFEENIYNYLITTNGDNIVKKINTNNILYNQDFYIYKDTTNKNFVIYTGSANENYAYIDKLGNSVNKDDNLGKTYKRVFNNQTDVLRHKIEPNEITNLVLHLDAQNIDGTNNSTLSDLDSITTWNDLSGNNNNATQTNFINKPIYTSTGITYNPYVKFDGNKILEIANSGLLNNDSDAGTNIIYDKKSIALVLKTGFDNTTFQNIYEQGDATKGYAIQIENGNLYAGIWNTSWDAGHQYKYLDLGEVVPESIYFIVFTQDSTSTNDNENKLKIYLNGNFIDEIDHIDPQSEQNGGIGLGGVFNYGYNLYSNIDLINENYSEYFLGAGIGEFIIWNYALSDNDIRGLNNYFTTKWLNLDEHIIYNIITNKTIKYNF